MFVIGTFSEISGKPSFKIRYKKLKMKNLSRGF